MKYLSPVTNFQDKGSQLFNVKAYGAKGDGSTDDSAAIQSAITAASAAGGGVVFFPPGNYKVSSTSRTDTVSFRSGSTFNDTSCISGDVGKYVLWGNLGRVAKITAVTAGSFFTVDVLPTTTAATTARIIAPGIVIPEGVYLLGAGSNYNTQLTAGSATGNVCTQITDAGTGVTVLIQGANSPSGGSTRYGISNMSILGNTGNLCGLFVGNGAWLIDSRNLELSSHGVAGLMLDGNINSHNFTNLVTYGNGTASAAVATGGVYTHPYNAAGSASCNFYNAFFSANYGFGIFDGDTGGSYGVVLWDPQFNSQQATSFANSGTSMVLQSKGTGDGMGICIGGWSETAALYDVITSGYVTIIGMRMHSSHAYHWIVNGGIANAIGCTFEGASTATAQLNSSGVFSWNGIKVTTDPVLYSGAPAVASLPSMGTSGTSFANSITGNGITNTGDFTVKDATTPTKAMRFQTSGASLDVAFGGTDYYLSVWSAAGFTGTQKFYQHGDSAGNFDAFQVWRWHSGVGTTTMMTLDPGNTTTPLQIHGGLSLDGATSGTTSVVPTAVAGTTTLTLPAATDTLVGKATTDALTNKDITSGTNTFPTFNQNTTGSAAKLTTARTINGVSFDGSANITLTPRINSTASSATPAINTDTTDQFNITALAAAITSMTSSLSGTPVDGQKLLIRIKDNGTARAITWGTSFTSSGTATLLATTVISKTHLIGLIYDSAVGKFVCQAVDSVGY